MSFRSSASWRLAASRGLALLLYLLLACGGSSTPPPTFRLSGSLAGVQRAGVTVQLAGAVSKAATSGPDGTFAFEGLAPGSYVVTPAPGSAYSVTPPSRAVTLVDRDVGALDFDLAWKTYALSGVVTGSVVEGIAITLQGGPSYSAVTDATGAFTFRDVPTGSYEVRPASPEWRYEPISRHVRLDADVTGVAFAVVDGRRISGTVTGAEATVTIELLTGGRAVATDPAGGWRLGSLADGQVVVAPRLPGYTFEPASRAVTLAGADVAGLDFLARPRPACGPVGLASQNPLPHGTPLWALWGAAPDDVWAAGDVLLHWDGARWSEGLACSEYLLGLWGSGPDDVWAVGERGTILRWGGASWAAVPSPTAETLTSVWGAGPDDVWAVGEAGAIIHWDGVAWTAVADVAAELFEVRGNGPDDVWAVGAGVILHWDGAAWTTDAVVARLFGLWTTAGDGWAVGFDGAFTRWDGTAWLPVTTPLGAGFVGRSAWGSGPDDVWVAGSAHHADAAAIAHWDGAAWLQVATPASASASYLYEVWGLDATHAWAVGVSGSVLAWDGDAWTDGGGGSRQPIFATGGFGAGQAWAFDGGILGWDGTSWARTPVPTGLTMPVLIRAAWSSGPGDLWAGGAGGVLLHWDGVDWAALVSPTTDDILGIWGAGAGDLWLVGRGGMAFHRPPGGAWTQVATHSGEDLLAMSGSGPDDAWVVAKVGGLLHWDGAGFTPYPLPRTFFLSDVAAVSPTEAWAVGGDGLVLRWDGMTWEPDALPAADPFAPAAVCAVAPGDVWVAGSGGAVAHWDGAAWATVRTGTRADLVDLACDASGQVRAVGERGAIVAR